MLAEHWSLVENDLQDRGVDLGDENLLRDRSWVWLRTRIEGLITADCRLTRQLAPPPEPRR